MPFHSTHFPLVIPWLHDTHCRTQLRYPWHKSLLHTKTVSRNFWAYACWLMAKEIDVVLYFVNSEERWTWKRGWNRMNIFKISQLFFANALMYNKCDCRICLPYIFIIYSWLHTCCNSKEHVFFCSQAIDIMLLNITYYVITNNVIYFSLFKSILFFVTVFHLHFFLVL